MSQTGETDRQNKYDVFKVGDSIPWRDDYATVVGRETFDELPDGDELADWVRDHHPARHDDDAGYALLTVEKPDGETYRVSAYDLVFSAKANFDKHGLPSVSANLSDAVGVGSGGRCIGVQTPATGNNRLDAGDAERLAMFLRAWSHFEPLYALLGGVDSPEDIQDVADALDRAATVYELAGRLQGD